MIPQSSANVRPRVLCVDLDGTLLKGNSLFEVLFARARTSPWVLFQFPFWLLRGQQHAWCRLMDRHTAPVRVDTFPFREETVEFLAAQRAAGREIWLVTGAHGRVAASISERLGGFAGVLATDASRHLVGKHKREELVQRFGAGQFDYAGDSKADLAVWKSAATAYLVSSASQFREQLELGGIATIHIPARSQQRSPWPAACRIRGWWRNLPILLPLTIVKDRSQILSLIAGFAALCAANASAALLRDLLSLDADRLDSARKQQPLAAGDLALPAAALAAALLAGLALLLSGLVSWRAAVIVILYGLAVGTFRDRLVLVCSALAAAAWYFVA